MKNKKNFIGSLAFAMLLTLPLGASAQQADVSTDPTPEPLSYAASQLKTADNRQKGSALTDMVKVRRHRQAGTYTATPTPPKRPAGLNNLLLKHKPLQIDANKVRRAPRASKKAPFRPDNNHTHLIVNICFNSVDETKEGSLFALDVVTGELTRLTDVNFFDYENYGFNGGAYVWNGKYRGVFYEQGEYATSEKPAQVMDFDMTDWSFDEDAFLQTSIPYHTTMAVECATEFHADGTTSVIGQFWGTDGNGNLLLRYATLDADGIHTTRFGEMGAAQKHMLAMGVTNDGRLYGVAKDGNLYQIDRATGKENLVGHTGIRDIEDYEGHFYLQGGEIDPRDNTFYWAVEHATDGSRSQLCSVDLNTGRATVLVEFAGDVECTGMIIAPQQRQNGTPQAVTDLTVSFGSLQTTGVGQFTAPTRSFDGNLLATDAPIYYKVYVNDVLQTVANNQTTPGATVTFDIAATNVKNNSENTIRVTTSLGQDGEEGLSASAKAWVGYGIPQSPKNVQMTFNEEAGTCTITWEHPATGDNAGVKGGRVDQVKYFVNRLVDGDITEDIHGGVMLADDVTSITYTLTDEDKATTMFELSFSVEAWAAPNGSAIPALAGEPAATNGTIVGIGKSVPYFVDFANDYYNVRQKDFTIIDGNKDGKTWGFCEPHDLLGQPLSGAIATNNYSTTLKNDEWFITPPIDLKAGKYYRFRSNMHGPSSTLYEERVEIRVGTDRTPESMTQVIVGEETVEDYCMKENDFTVPEDGNYYIAIHVVSEPNQWEVAVFDISVEESDGSLCDRKAPLAVQLAATPVYGVSQSAGQYVGAADITIKLPQETRDGMKLTAANPLNVTLLATSGSNTETVAELAAQTPGATITCRTADLPSGEYTFSVQAAYTADGEKHVSPIATTTGYVGWDNAPALPTNSKMVQNGSELKVVFTPDEQPKGVHGAYLPSVSYRAYSGSKANQIAYYLGQGNAYILDYILPDAESNGNELIVPDVNPSEGGQYNFSCYLMAVSQDATGKNIYSDLLPISTLIGEPEPAPVIETGNYEYIKDGRLSPELEEVWNFWMNRGTSIAGIQPIEDQFGFDTGKSWYVFSAFNGELSAIFGKVDISTLTNPVLRFDLILEDSNTDMEVVINGPAGQQAIHKMTVKEGFQNISIPLDEYKSWGWIQPDLKCIFHLEVNGDHYHDIFFDNVGVYNAAAKNLAILSVEAADQLTAGEETMVNVSVLNMGQQPVKDYTVTLMEDEAVVASETVKRSLQPGEFTVVQFDYHANTVNALDNIGFDEAEKVLTATLDAEGDEIESDNTGETVVTISVKGGTTNTAPTNAVAQYAEGSAAVNVSWSYDAASAQSVTESFENYELWDVGGVKSRAPEGYLGQWRLYDGDGQFTYALKGMDILTPNAGEPQAWQVFQGDLFAGLSEYYYYDWEPVSGEQYLVSMDPADGNYTPRPDDYLISPEVKGGSVLEFYYNSLTRKGQGLEVLYSETGRDVADFKPLQTFDITGGYSDEAWYLAVVTLPQTAKYFAIRHSKGSNKGYGVRIDDVTYVKLSAVDHFNIYVDGRLVGTSTETSFTISEGLEEGGHRIAITAVFGDGIETLPAYVDFNVMTGINEILKSGEPFDVYSLDGKLVRKQVKTVEGLKGVYIVNNQRVVLQ